MGETREKPTKAKKTKKYDKPYICGDTQDIFTPDPGEVEGPVNCGVCGTEMECKRNCHGPRGWAMAMSGSKSYYDCFSCPHRGELWHKQVVKLRSAVRDTPSRKLADLFLEEVNEILDTRQATKETGYWQVF